MISCLRSQLVLYAYLIFLLKFPIFLLPHLSSSVYKYVQSSSSWKYFLWTLWTPQVTILSHSLPLANLSEEYVLWAFIFSPRRDSHLMPYIVIWLKPHYNLKHLSPKSPHDLISRSVVFSYQVWSSFLFEMLISLAWKTHYPRTFGPPCGFFFFFLLFLVHPIHSPQMEMRLSLLVFSCFFSNALILSTILASKFLIQISSL